MQFNQLPKTVIIGHAADPGTLSNFLSKIDGIDTLFTHFETVTGAERSGRIIAPHHLPNGVKTMRPLNRLGVAIELEKITRESRYEPRHPPAPNMTRGWEIHKLVLDGKPTALALAAWIPNA